MSTVVFMSASRAGDSSRPREQGAVEARDVADVGDDVAGGPDRRRVVLREVEQRALDRVALVVVRRASSPWRSGAAIDGRLDGERRVAQPQRPEDPPPDLAAQGPARRAARRSGPRARSRVFEYDQALPDGNSCGCPRRARPARGGSRSAGGRRGRARWTGDERVVRDARGVVEQLAERHLAAVREDARQPPLDAVVEREPPLVHQLERDGRDEGLADAGDRGSGRPGRMGRPVSRSATPRAPVHVELPSSTRATMPGAPAATTPSSACSSAGRWAAAGAAREGDREQQRQQEQRPAAGPATPWLREVVGRMG